MVNETNDGMLPITQYRIMPVIHRGTSLVANTYVVLATLSNVILHYFIVKDDGTGVGVTAELIADGVTYESDNHLMTGNDHYVYLNSKEDTLAQDEAVFRVGNGTDFRAESVSVRYKCNQNIGLGVVNAYLRYYQL